MENALNISQSQMFLLMVSQIWMFVIFPVIVIRKLNYLTAIMEAQFDNSEDDGQNT